MAKGLATFPFPFKEDTYRYSNNSVLLDPPYAVDLTSEYEEEITLKRKLLLDHPTRCFQALPHTNEAQWEIVSLILHNLAEMSPDDFQLHINGDIWTFTNHKTNEREQFIFGNNASLPYEPLNFVGRHVQEDLILMGQRDHDLYLDAGQLCFPANWSLEFNLGMTFVEIHSPITRFTEGGLDVKIRNFIMRLEAGKPWVRRNWSLNAGRRLDTSLETFHLWGQERQRVTADNAGQLVQLRVEVQKLFRLPRTHSILFTIHTHLISLEEIAQKRSWLAQIYNILVELPDYIAEYKGMMLYKNAVLAYLENKLQQS